LLVQQQLLVTLLANIFQQFERAAVVVRPLPCLALQAFGDANLTQVQQLRLRKMFFSAIFQFNSQPIGD